MEASAARVSQKETTARDIAEFLVGRYSLTTTPRVLMWREVVGEYYESRNWKAPEWVRDFSEVHAHWKKYGKLVQRVMQEQHGLTTIPVSRRIRDCIKHGDMPSRDDTRRTDSFYRDCLPSSAWPVMGIAIFPRDTFADHPLVTAALARRSVTSANGFANAIDAVDRAEDRGAITADTKTHIVGSVIPTVTQAVEHANKPHVPAIEGKVVGELVD